MIVLAELAKHINDSIVKKKYKYKKIKKPAAVKLLMLRRATAGCSRDRELGRIVFSETNNNKSNLRRSSSSVFCIDQQYTNALQHNIHMNRNTRKHIYMGEYW